MFATSDRVSPCSARSSPRSVGRVTTTSPSRCSIFIRVGTCCCSVPSGPATATRAGSIVTLTPSGMGMGALPIRLIRLPDEGDHFAADAALLRGTARDETGRRREDRDAHPAEHARKAVLPGVDPAARLRHALQAGDDPLAVAAELEIDDQRIEGIALLHVVVADVALLLEEAGDVDLHPRGRHRGVLVQRLVGVADAGEHVCNRIGQHRSLLPARFRHAGNRTLVRELAEADPAEAELAEDRARAAAPVAARVVAHLVLLGSPLLDDERRLRHYSFLLSPSAKGRPRACSSARACSSVWAVVVIVTSSPRTCWMSS